MNFYFSLQGPTISPVFCKRDGKVYADYYALVICVPKKALYKSVQQLRAVSLMWVFMMLLLSLLLENQRQAHALASKLTEAYVLGFHILLWFRFNLFSVLWKDMIWSVFWVCPSSMKHAVLMIANILCRLAEVGFWFPRWPTFSMRKHQDGGSFSLN